MQKVLVTGVAGFIGFHVAKACLAQGWSVVGIDNMSDYYDVTLKESRLKQLAPLEAFEFFKLDLADRKGTADFFANHAFDRVVHLAAQAGVRYSLLQPFAYVDSNVSGTLSVLEGCRHSQVEHLVFASSSSVYGINTSQPFSVHDSVDHPLSLYAATKKANEMMAHSYSHLFQLPTTGLRFFTVYGPWGRPDMALFKFTKAILEGTPIDVYNSGKMLRDFTFVDDIASSIVKVMECIPQPRPNWDCGAPDPSTSRAPYQIHNIGNQDPIELSRFIEVLEESIGKKAIKNMLPMQAGDVPATYADVSSLQQAIGFTPATPIEVGIRKFVDWYRDYYHVP
jgi:UDP-glucuronate 4-epimerase